MSTEPRHAPEQAAGTATAEDGVVTLDGPANVAVTMTADAADGTARSLTQAATQARIQLAGRR